MDKKEPISVPRGIVGIAIICFARDDKQQCSPPDKINSDVTHFSSGDRKKQGAGLVALHVATVEVASPFLKHPTLYCF